MSDSNDANAKKKTVRNCDIIHIKIKFFYTRGNTPKRKQDGGAHFRNFAPWQRATQQDDLRLANKRYSRVMVVQNNKVRKIIT